MMLSVQFVKCLANLKKISKGNDQMDYSNPTLSGQRAFLRGVKRIDNPVSRRTHANAHTLWDKGWVKQSAIKCNGIELSDGSYSGCTQVGGDCPICGK